VIGGGGHGIKRARSALALGVRPFRRASLPAGQIPGAPAGQAVRLMAGLKRPAAYIRVGRGYGAGAALDAQQRAIRQAAREHGWPEPAMYVDIDGAGTGQPMGSGQVADISRATGRGRGLGQALAKLNAAISTGRHDALILGGIATIRGTREDLAGLLSGCTRHGVTVECATPVPPASSDKPQQGRGGWT